MHPEHYLVPYHSCELPPGPWLVFAPHADDETFGMGGALRLAANHGIDTHVVVLTDGALGGPQHADAAQVAALVARRQDEVRQACELLGVATVLVWDHPDRGLQSTRPLIDRITAAISDFRAGTVFFPGVLEIHPDHRATASVVWQALQQQRARAGGHTQPRAWSYEISVQSPLNRLLDISPVLSVKEQAMAVYASQNSQNNYQELILALNKARTFSLPASVSHAEAFFCYPDEDLNGSLYAAAEKALRRYWDPASEAGDQL
jgi:N-acetylglucosamine malate deacetylase 1